MSCHPTEIFLQGSSVQLAGKRWKSGDTPVLALHGWLDNCGTFDRLAPLLEGLDLVAIDFPGHGLSGHRTAGYPYHFVDWVPEVFAAARELGWEKFNILGHSMGAAVGCLAAGTFPQQIERLAIIEGIGPYTHADEDSPAQLAKALLHRSSPKPRVYEDRQKAVQRLIARGLLPESAECLATRALKQTEDGWTFTYAMEARAPSRARLSEAQVRAFLAAIECPTLLLAADDGLKMPTHFEGRKEAFHQLKFVSLEKGGHHLHLDYPELVADLVNQHLQS